MEEGKKLRLLCIPPSATSAMMYLKWQEHFPENIEIVPIELPGKGTKFREKMADSIDEMTDRIIDEIKEKAGNENQAAPPPSRHIACSFFVCYPERRDRL